MLHLHSENLPIVHKKQKEARKRLKSTQPLNGFGLARIQSESISLDGFTQLPLFRGTFLRPNELGLLNRPTLASFSHCFAMGYLLLKALTHLFACFLHMVEPLVSNRNFLLVIHILIIFGKRLIGNHNYFTRMLLARLYFISSS